MEIIQHPAVANLVLVVSVLIALFFLPVDFRFEDTDANGDYIDID